MLISLTSSLYTPYNLKSILMRKIFDMRLNVSDIPGGGLQTEPDLPVEINDSAGPDVVHVRINASRFGKKILIEGSFKDVFITKMQPLFERIFFSSECGFQR